ncbi:MAG: tetratricopeptide repeat protein, partial [Candidatus Subteraquimicrobiales bacterium]|nr:tetratricopeptide repeat protein [Candidatus Subteraquimicrobiales bacterium]
PTAHNTQETIRHYLRLGNAFHEEGNYNKAIEMFNEVLNREPNNEDALEGIEKARQARELIDGLL